jgi:hypothetical protein
MILSEGNMSLRPLKICAHLPALLKLSSPYYNFTGLSTLKNGSLGKLAQSSFENMLDRPSNRGIVFTLSCPIADWGRSKNLVQREERRLKQRELEQEDTKRTIETQVRKIVRNVYEVEIGIKLSKK